MLLTLPEDYPEVPEQHQFSPVRYRKIVYTEIDCNRVIWQSLLNTENAIPNLLAVPDLELKLRLLIDTRPVDAALILARYFIE